AMPPTNPHRIRRKAVLTPQGHESNLKLTRRQKEAIEALAGVPEGVPISELKERDIPAAIFRRLAARGLVTFARERIDRDPFESGVVRAAVSESPNRELTGEQAHAVQSLRAAAGERKFAV